MQDFKKNGAPQKEITSLTKICIDDFAIKKGKSYGTVMIDIDSHRIVDMIPSREYADVKVWLQTYPNINLVSRDGSATYRKAIADALPGAIQVSDRFHLLKNLTDYAKEYIKRELNTKVKVSIVNEQMTANDHANPEIKAIPNKPSEHKILAFKKKCEQIPILSASGYTKSAICKKLGLDVRTYHKHEFDTPIQIEKMALTSREIKHDQKVQQKMERVNEVRGLKSQGLSSREISRRVGLARGTISKYLKDTFNPSHAAYGEKSVGKLTIFENEIDSMLTQGIKGPAIYKQIQEKGYTGSLVNLRHYMSEWKRRQKQNSEKNCQILAPPLLAKKLVDEMPNGEIIDTSPNHHNQKEIISIERKNLLKFLYNTTENVKSVTAVQLDAVFEQYPSFLKIFSLVWDFKYIIASKDPELLDPWLERVQLSDIAEIKSFSEGIKLDYNAVKNAIELPYSNGLAEGSVNKIKVIKRIMFGRCSFTMLKIKTLCLSKFQCFN